MIPLFLAVITAGQGFACTPVSLWDGDGPFLCAEGPRVRLAGIAAREMDGSCRSNQPCPDASAEAARDTLAQLLGTPAGTTSDSHIRLINAPTLRCLSTGSAGGKRTGAWCYGPQGDISCRLVQARVVKVWPRYWKDHECRR